MESFGRRCIVLKKDITVEENAKWIVKKVLADFGKLDILINNAGTQVPKDDILDISEEQLLLTFKTNVFSQFFMVKACLPYLHAGASIINTTSVTAYEGNSFLIDYSSSKGAIVSFTRSLQRHPCQWRCPRTSVDTPNSRHL